MIDTVYLRICGGCSSSQPDLTQPSLAKSTIMAPQAPALCTTCNTATTKVCGQCESAHYCSKDCIKADRKLHKLLCATYANFKKSNRPSKEHSRAISFPADGNSPEFVWLKHKLVLTPGQTQDLYQMPELRPFLGVGDCLSDSPLRYNHVLKRKLPDFIRVSFRDNFLLDKLHKNDCHRSGKVLEMARLNHCSWRVRIWRRPCQRSRHERLPTYLRLLCIRGIRV